MSIEVAILCDECGRVIDAGKTAAQARTAIREAGGRVGLPGGRDICPWCVTGSPVGAGEPLDDGARWALHLSQMDAAEQPGGRP